MVILLNIFLFCMKMQRKAGKELSFQAELICLSMNKSLGNTISKAFNYDRAIEQLIDTLI